MKFKTCKNANYYDLVKVPHGHIPAPMVKFWKNLPIPIKGERNYSTFECPECGEPSFFKIEPWCNTCECFMIDESYKAAKDRALKRQKKDKLRAKWKKLEYMLLPILILFGKAWYMPSVRRHVTDFYKSHPQFFHQNNQKSQRKLDEYVGGESKKYRGD